MIWKGKHLLVEDFIITLNNLTFFMNQSRNVEISRNGWVANSWLSTGIHNDSNNTDLFSVNNSNNNSSTLLNQNNRLGVIFNGNYMKQNKLGYDYGSVVNTYIVYSLKNRNINSPDFTVQNELFGAIKIIKDVNTSQYAYSGYGICFDSGGPFTFYINTQSSIHSTNKTHFLLLGKDFIQGIHGTTLYAENLQD